MKRPERPDVVDLRRYRAERAKAAERKTAAPPASKQPLLGARKGAGPILALVVLVLLALWLGPRFF